MALRVLAMRSKSNPSYHGRSGKGRATASPKPYEALQLVLASFQYSIAEFRLPANPITQNTAQVTATMGMDVRRRKRAKMPAEPVAAGVF
jgi:hypothetical protein